MNFVNTPGTSDPINTADVATIKLGEQTRFRLSGYPGIAVMNYDGNRFQVTLHLLPGVNAEMEFGFDTKTEATRFGKQKMAAQTIDNYYIDPLTHPGVTFTRIPNSNLYSAELNGKHLGNFGATKVAIAQATRANAAA